MPTMTSVAKLSNPLVEPVTPTQSKIVARLDAYLPVLNTGLMDGKIQDVIIKHPLVRSLVVPECDLEARRRCIGLVSRVLDVATPLLPLILQDHQERQDELTKRARASGKPPQPPAGSAVALEPLKQRVPHLSAESQARLMSVVQTMADRDPLVRFWLNHYNTHKLGAQAPQAGRKRKSVPTHNGYLDMPTFNLFVKVKNSKQILSDLADRIQGAVCKAFWECWDEIFITLAEIAGVDEVQKVDTGRIFRACGDAGVYLNNIKSQKKRQLEEKRRLSILAQQRPAQGQRAFVHFQPVTTPPSFIQEQHHEYTAASISVPPLSPDKSASPESTDSNMTSTMPQLAGEIEINPNMSLIDSGELDFIMQDVYMNDSHRDKQSLGLDHLLGPLPTLEEDTSGTSLFNCGVPTVLPQKQQQPSTLPLWDAPTPLSTASPAGSAGSAGSPSGHLNLRDRIKLMEEGKMLDERPSPSNIIW